MMQPLSLQGESVFVSWSGGKDCCLAMLRAVEAGARVGGLVTMMIDSGQRSRSHGLSLGLLRAQAGAMSLPLHTAATSRVDYRDRFVATIEPLIRAGVRHGVFGDLAGPNHREWEEGVCTAAGGRGVLPLWGADPAEIVREQWARGIVSRLVAVRDGVLPPELLGKVLTPERIDDFVKRGIDPCGEGGEFHTAVVDCPLFHSPIELQQGEIVLRDGAWFIDLIPATRRA